VYSTWMIFEAHATQTAWRARAGRPRQRQRAVGCRQRGRAGRGGRQPAGLGGRALGCGRRRGRRRRCATRRARLQVRGAPATWRWAGLLCDHCRCACEVEQPPQGVGSVRAALLSAATLPLGRCKLWWAILVCATVGRACSCWCCSECKRAVGAARERAAPAAACCAHGLHKRGSRRSSQSRVSGPLLAAQRPRRGGRRRRARRRGGGGRRDPARGGRARAGRLRRRAPAEPGRRAGRRAGRVWQ